MGLGEKTILSVGDDIRNVTIILVQSLVDDESGLISLYYGEDIADEDANKMADELMELYPDLDVEVHYGGQPIYYYLLSVE